MLAPYAPLQLKSQQHIHAELIGSDRCTGVRIEAHGAAPVLELCRAVVAAGHDPAVALDAYRGGTLCLSIRSIGEAAGLEINAKGTGFIPRRAVRTGSPIAPSQEEAPRVPPTRRAIRGGTAS